MYWTRVTTRTTTKSTEWKLSAMKPRRLSRLLKGTCLSWRVSSSQSVLVAESQWTRFRSSFKRNAIRSRGKLSKSSKNSSATRTGKTRKDLLSRHTKAYSMIEEGTSLDCLTQRDSLRLRRIGRPLINGTLNRIKTSPRSSIATAWHSSQTTQILSTCRTSKMKHSIEDSKHKPYILYSKSSV